MGEPVCVLGGGMPQLYGKGTPVLQTLLDLVICTSSSPCSFIIYYKGRILCNILYNKLVIESKVFPEFCKMFW